MLRSSDCLLDQQRPLLTAHVLTVGPAAVILLLFNLFVLVLAAEFINLQTAKIQLICDRKPLIIH